MIYGNIQRKWLRGLIFIGGGNPHASLWARGDFFYRPVVSSVRIMEAAPAAKRQTPGNEGLFVGIGCFNNCAQHFETRETDREGEEGEEVSAEAKRSVKDFPNSGWARKYAVLSRKCASEVRAVRARNSPICRQRKILRRILRVKGDSCALPPVLSSTFSPPRR